MLDGFLWGNFLQIASKFLNLGGYHMWEINNFFSLLCHKHCQLSRTFYRAQISLIDQEKQSFLRPLLIKNWHNFQVFCPLQCVALRWTTSFVLCWPDKFGRSAGAARAKRPCGHSSFCKHWRTFPAKVWFVSKAGHKWGTWRLNKFNFFWSWEKVDQTYLWICSCAWQQRAILIKDKLIMIPHHSIT